MGDEDPKFEVLGSNADEPGDPEDSDDWFTVDGGDPDDEQTDEPERVYEVQDVQAEAFGLRFGPFGDPDDLPPLSADQPVLDVQETVETDDEPGRNDDCPCRSGRTYKHCCHRKDDR